MDHLAEYHIEEITAAKRAARGDGFVFFVKWMGLDEAEGTWEPVSRVMADAPAILEKELKKLKLSTDEKRSLRECYGLSV